MSTAQLTSLLGRWHQWRQCYTPERGYAKARTWHYNAENEDELETMLMRAVDTEVELMSRELRLAVQHVARAECLGVEVMMNPAMTDAKRRATLVAIALAQLERKLLHAGVL